MREENQTLQGVRWLQRLQPLLARLRDNACQRDRAGNRQLFFDQVCSLILLTFFNPTLTSLRDLSQASRLRQVRQKLGCRAASLGSLSEAMHVFDPELLREILQELLSELPQTPGGDPRLAALAHVPTAVDGTLLRQLPQITQACFASRRDRGWKLHVHFEVLRSAATSAVLTDASGQDAANEKAVLRAQLEAGRTYITDRGYEEFALFNAIVAAGSSYVCRVRGDHHFTTERRQPLAEEAQRAGVCEDALGRMGSPKSQRIEHPQHPQRRIVVQVPPARGRRGRPTSAQTLVLATNLLDVPASVIAVLYQHRWLIELFFRWLKCVLACRHLLSRTANGLEIQMYCALIACLLVQLAGGAMRPQQWTYKLLCLYLQGWAEEDEVLAHLQQRAFAASQPG